MKTAVITGASSGIGFQISKKLINLGIKVYGFGRNFKKISFSSENFITIECDITKIEELCKHIDKIKKENEINILVNNAGVGYFGPHEEINPKKIHEMVCINLEVPLVLTQMLLRDLKKNSGCIINISSVTAKKSNTHGCAYGATKAGLANFSSSLFDEVRKYNVKVTSIYPDITKSNFYRNANFQEEDSKDSYLFDSEIADLVEFILNQRKEAVISEITIQPQKHKIKRKNI